ncbi:MAG: M90 family metallopeptidase, partial [Flavobacteriales bacterium]
LIVALVVGLIAIVRYLLVKKKRFAEAMDRSFPEEWRNFLRDHVAFYEHLRTQDRLVFEHRVQLFLAEKRVEGIDTDIDDTVRLMVASSAIIPVFAFPGYTYPHVHEVLIYPNSFDSTFQTQRYAGHREYISGMVGNRFMNGTVALSKADLVRDFDGTSHRTNVGVHEFVHLLDKEDGAVDGIPEMLMKHAYVGPWLHEIKEEVARIEKGKSDINPYALKSNAEFLAVVSEYFFEDPEKMRKKHPEMYAQLSEIFNTVKTPSPHPIPSPKESG